ncbi:unnamed protein product [Lathyrus sativus]|nr:unnamed protein product [Lathyrus sativus]
MVDIEDAKHHYGLCHACWDHIGELELGGLLHMVIPSSNETLGVLILKSPGFFPQAYWYWIGVGALIGYVFLFNFFFALALHYLSPFR